MGRSLCRRRERAPRTSAAGRTAAPSPSPRRSQPRLSPCGSSRGAWRAPSSPSRSWFYVRKKREVRTPPPDWTALCGPSTQPADVLTEPFRNRTASNALERKMHSGIKGSILALLVAHLLCNCFQSTCSVPHQGQRSQVRSVGFPSVTHLPVPVPGAARSTLTASWFSSPSPTRDGARHCRRKPAAVPLSGCLPLSVCISRWTLWPSQACGTGIGRSTSQDGRRGRRRPEAHRLEGLQLGTGFFFWRKETKQKPQEALENIKAATKRREQAFPPQPRQARHRGGGTS